ncbi:hypothetical protein [Magnetospirillum sp. 64-120]|uniref:hypothetical protein n=1 Tax=Magnetospirillum sp. 64-120 TaxID=1895778 RepID=UPI00092A74F8|nr:hypothetical protein [Magnetospirillum sp. 64-120]OJX68139.1 MAG: hypothetical protein BGO92_05650 [Magnetospirillum sp. 64-120]
MSASAVASSGYTDPNAFVPVFASENATNAAAEKQEQAKHLTMFGEGDDSPSFWDLLDVINPLQHIPIVNEIYQDLTGDKIGVAARLAGGGLFGGPIGLVASAIGCLVEEETGDTIGGHVVALFKDDEAAPTQVAKAETQPQPQAAETKPAAMAPVQVAMASVNVPEAPPATPPQNAAPLMFSADGMINPTATAAAAVAAPVPVTPAAAPMPLSNTSKTNRIMPVPARTVSTAEQAPPPITVPISSGGNRSNVPITGHNPLNNHATVDPLAVQKAMALQGLPSETQHPMLQANPKAASGSADWLGAMNQALDKYQKAGNLAARPEDVKSPAY